MRKTIAAFGVSTFIAVSLVGCSSSKESPTADGAHALQPDSLELPGSAFYPTSIYASGDGALFVGSAGTGEVVKFAAGSTRAQVVVPQATPPIVVPGIAVDDAASTLYVCSVAFGGPSFTKPAATLRSYDLDGRPLRAWSLPDQGSSICEDVAVGAKHDVYVTDAFLGRVYRLADGGDAITVWAEDERLKPGSNPVPPFGAHGLTYDGDASLYVSNFNTSELLRIAIEPGGAAGHVTPVTVTPPIQNPEALRTIDAHTLAVAEDVWGSENGFVAAVHLNGDDTATQTTLRSGLKGPTSLAFARDNWWIAEGQVSSLVAQTAPTLPFRIERAAAQ